MLAQNAGVRAPAEPRVRIGSVVRILCSAHSRTRYTFFVYLFIYDCTICEPEQTNTFSLFTNMNIVSQAQHFGTNEI